MKTMKFDTVKNSVSINIFSKSALATFDQCQAKAYQKVRNKKEDQTRPLLVGKTAHELFAKKIANIKGVPYNPKLVASPSIMREAKSLVDYIDFKSLIGKSKIIGFENFAETVLPNNQKLLGVFDLTLYEDDEFIGEYIKILDYKTGFKISKEVDNEAIVYAHLAAKLYGLPVMFARYSGRSKDYFEHYFSYDEAISFGELISVQVDDMKKTIEGSEMPFPSSGAHCETCPFLDKCLERGYVTEDMDSMITQQRLYAAKAKELKGLIKEYNLEQGGEVKSEMYTTFIKESRTPKLLVKNNQTKKKKAVTKKDFVRLLSESGMLDEFVSALDIKYTPEVINQALELGLELGETVKRDISIELTTDYDGAEGEFDEED